MEDKKRPLVSIVLPVYNGEKYLEISIQSCINQTYKNWELLVIDDGSIDRTEEIVRKFEKEDNRIHFFKNKENLKLPKALNRGFSLAKGEYLTWTSDDNYFRTEALEQMVNKLQESKCGLVFSSYSIINEEGKEMTEMVAPKDYKHSIWSYNVVGACFLYSREVYECIGEYDPTLFLCEDYDYWLRVFQKFEVTYIEENLYAYRRHNKALTTTHKAGQHEALEKVLLKNFKEKKNAETIDYYYLYRGLHRSRRLQKTWKRKYEYFLRFACYQIWYMLMYRK